MNGFGLLGIGIGIDIGIGIGIGYLRRRRTWPWYSLRCWLQTGPGSPECVPDLPPGPRCHTRSFSGATMQCLAQISHNPCTAFKKYVTIQQHADTDTPKSATVLFKINATHCCYTQILYNQVIWPELYYHYVVAPSSLNHTHCHPPPHTTPTPLIS